MRNDYVSGYLSHHGIQGQKWGVKHGPPYPLESSEKSSSEKEKKSLSDKRKRQLAIGATIVASTLATYGVYKLAKTGALSAVGRKVSKPYLKTNLQFFADKKSKPVYSDGGCKFKNKDELDRAERAFHRNNLSAEDWNKPTLIKPVQTDDKEKGAFWYHAYKSEDDDKFKITHKVNIRDSATGLYERNKYGKK